MTITTMAIGEIDGDFVTGICFVGVISKAARTGLLLAPLAATMIVSAYIIARGLLLLIKVKAESEEIISEHSSRKIRSNIVRMGVFATFMTIFCFITFGYHHYLFQNTELWQNSLRSYILCKLTNLGFDSSHCKQDSRPSVAMLQLQLLALFGIGLSMASWVWCDSTLHTWGRYIRRKFNCEVEEPMKLPKHKIIAQAFAKRKKFNEGGQISILCQNHTDPVGLHFELNSVASNELSTTWAANLARFVNRRGAVPNEIANSISSNNQSLDSEVSLNVRHVSIESRRNSGDSQLSVQIAELKATRKVKSRRHRTTHKRYCRRNSRNLGNSTSKLSKSTTKRDSSTSLDSHMQLINALTHTGDIKSFAPNLNRRVANAGLDGQHIQQLLSNGKLVIPRATSCNGKTYGSEDENVSVTYSESTINMKVQNNLDLNDELVMKSLKQGLKIEHLDSSSCEDSKDYDQEKKTKSGRESHSSRRSKRSKMSRKKYTSKSSGSNSDSSSCPEIKQLVQSSLNSGVSTEKTRQGSRQSKMSNDVAIQTNATDMDIEMKSLNRSTEDEKKPKSKKMKTKENKKYRSSSKYLEDKMRQSKEKYREYGSSQERQSLYKDKTYSDMSDEELINKKEKNKASIKKSKEMF
ncbi:unnamed protein product [Acanthoscelides obtectus]|nr:unnamed protein product [Acanthoscelides obtectus]CAK1678519.1 Protein smoothened [Acanthoscelides obtectus]